MSTKATTKPLLPYDRVIKGGSPTVAADLTTQMNNALAEAATYTRQFSLAFKGHFDLTTSLSAYDHTNLELFGKITRNAALNDDMVKSAADDQRMLWIHGGWWDGGDVAQPIFDIDTSYVGSVNVDMRFYNMRFSNVHGYCFDILNMNVGKIFDIIAEDDVYYFVTLAGAADNDVAHCILATTGAGPVFYHGEGGNITVDDVYLGGGRIGYQLVGVDGFEMSNCIINSTSRQGILLQDTGAVYCRHNKFEFKSNECGQEANNTYDVVELQGHSHHNRFDCDIFSTHANKPRYCWNESDANCNSNTIHDSICMDAVTGQIRIQGAATIKPDCIEA